MTDLLSQGVGDRSEDEGDVVEKNATVVFGGEKVAAVSGRDQETDAVTGSLFLFEGVCVDCVQGIIFTENDAGGDGEVVKGCYTPQVCLLFPTDESDCE
jgi:hypothetical protein